MAKEKAKHNGLLYFLLTVIVMLIVVIGSGIYYLSIRDNSNMHPESEIYPGENAGNSNKKYIEYVNGEKKIAYIPAGFTVSKIPSESTIEGGLVIYSMDKDTTEGINWRTQKDKKGNKIKETYNQYVWVPVEEINEFAVLQEGSDKDYRGVLWDFDNNKPTSYDLSNGCGEPVVVTVNAYSKQEDANVKNDESKENRDIIIEEGYENTVEGLKRQYQDEFNDMVESVKKYGGFFVGRYETSRFLSDIEIKENKVSISGYSWYDLYNEQKKLYSKSDKESVVSGMIWGCQWDTIVKWGLEGTKAERKYIESSEEKNKNKLKNIYDLGENHIEWTMEGATSGRSVRGHRVEYGLWGVKSYRSLTSRSHSIEPYNKYTIATSRVQLYIK